MSNTQHHDLRGPAAAAIEKAGGSAALGRALGIRRSAVHGWRMTGIPAARVAEVARISGIPAGQLRPDLAKVFAPAAPDGDAPQPAKAEAA